MRGLLAERANGFGGDEGSSKTGRSMAAVDSEIFNQFVRTIAWGRSHRCIMRNNRDGAPERFLVLAAAGFALLCCGLIAVAFS